MHAAGASAREMAEELGLNHGTIAIWLRDMGLEPNGGQGSRSTRSRRPPDAAQAAAAEAHRALARLSVVPPSAELGDSLSALRHHQTIARRLVEYHFKRANEGHTAVGDLDKAMNLEDRIATRIAELTPAAPADPETDAGNVEAASEVRGRFARLVETAERGFRCKCCGGDPYRGQR